MPPSAFRHCTAPAPPAKSTAPLGAPTRVRVLGVRKEHGRMFVAFACGADSRIVAAKASDLRSFAKFRHRVSVELGPLVDHECEHLPRHCDRRDAWKSADREAVLRGAQR